MHWVLLLVKGVMARSRLNATVYLSLGTIWDSEVQFDMKESQTWLEFVDNTHNTM